MAREYRCSELKVAGNILKGIISINRVTVSAGSFLMSFSGSFANLRELVAERVIPHGFEFQIREGVWGFLREFSELARKK